MSVGCITSCSRTCGPDLMSESVRLQFSRMRGAVLISESVRLQFSRRRAGWPIGAHEAVFAQRPWISGRPGSMAARHGARPARPQPTASAGPESSSTWAQRLPRARACPIQPMLRDTMLMDCKKSTDPRIGSFRGSVRLHISRAAVQAGRARSPERALHHGGE